ncbi:MAG: S1 RNA-binding domain-containing protein, partial [Acidobacteriota bacterium]|nr:S1 RNA-binding domain-containing protein [Acidobacteriota bacterium]
KDGVQDLRDLVPGMTLEGVVTNVANIGAVVDIGVHQDGLVHVSQLADRFVKDPREVVKAGDIVKVRVVEVDAGRKRIALTMKSGEVQAGVKSPGGPKAGAGPRPAPQPKPAAIPNTAFGAAFAKLTK